eukprot:scaffold41306_cov56-Phaeocystis_antarctica.AAC.5
MRCSQPRCPPRSRARAPPRGYHRLAAAPSAAPPPPRPAPWVLPEPAQSLRSSRSPSGRRGTRAGSYEWRGGPERELCPAELGTS